MEFYSASKYIPVCLITIFRSRSLCLTWGALYIGHVAHACSRVNKVLYLKILVMTITTIPLRYCVALFKTFCI